MRNRYEVQGDVTLISVYHRCTSADNARQMTALVDTADLPKLLEKKTTWAAWPARKSSTKFYAFAKLYDPQTRTKTTTSMHRFLLDPPAGLDVDHADNDGLNNKRSNLIVCTHKENMRKNKPPTYWLDRDLKAEQRRQRRTWLQAINEVIQQTGYTRGYIWKVRKGLATNPTISAMILAAHDKLLLHSQPSLR